MPPYPNWLGPVNATIAAIFEGQLHAVDCSELGCDLVRATDSELGPIPVQDQPPTPLDEPSLLSCPERRGAHRG